MNILVPDSVSPAALDVFRSEPGWNVIRSSPQEFLARRVERRRRHGLHVDGRACDRTTPSLL